MLLLCLELAPYLLCSQLVLPPCLSSVITSSRKSSLMSCVELPKSLGFPEHTVSSLLSCRTVYPSKSEILEARVRAQLTLAYPVLSTGPRRIENFW